MRPSDADDTDEWHYQPNRKDGKIERKRLIAKDRSKYKKTDQEKYLKGIAREQEIKISKKDWLEGRVLSIIPQGIVVDKDGETSICTLKGLLKKERTHLKNLVSVGDYVLFEKINETEGVISQILPRKTILSRADNLSRRKEQLIAVNIDQVIITTSVVDPSLKPPLIDRYIIATQKGGMDPIIVINKVDLLQSSDMDPQLIENEKALLEELIDIYQQAAIPLICVSTKTNQGMDLLVQSMNGKASVFSGQSGVGKSSLINAITGSQLTTGKTVTKTGKGAHTTTLTQLIRLPGGGWCVDTPGIKSFGVWDLSLDEIRAYFPEIHACSLSCKFLDCTHSHEEQCAVQKAVEEGSISPLRLNSYLALRETAHQKHLRR